MMATLFPGVALIVGAASGIGREVAISFARAGCTRIAIVDTDFVGLRQSRQLIQGLSLSITPDVLHLKIDVLDEEDVNIMVESTVKAWGRVDYAVNASGILGNQQRSTLTSSSHFDHINGVNYRGCWLCSRAQTAQMLKQKPLPTHDGRPGNRGSIVNIASQLGLVGRQNSSAYCASKAAVIGLTRADAMDCSSSNIRINCVCPGLVATPMLDNFEDEALMKDIAVAPMNRAGTPQEIADVTLFLASSKATFVQGAAYVVDGGYTIN